MKLRRATRPPRAPLFSNSHLRACLARGGTCKTTATCHHHRYPRPFSYEVDCRGPRRSSAFSGPPSHRADRACELPCRRRLACLSCAPRSARRAARCAGVRPRMNVPSGQDHVPPPGEPSPPRARAVALDSRVNLAPFRVEHAHGDGGFNIRSRFCDAFLPGVCSRVTRSGAPAAPERGLRRREE